MRSTPGKLEVWRAIALLVMSALAGFKTSASTLTLSEILGDSDGSPSVKRALSSFEESSWKRVESISGFLPSMRVGANRLLDKQYMLLDIPAPSGGTTSFAQVIPTTNFALTANWLVFDGFANVNRFSSAKHFEEAEQAELSWTRFRTRLELTLQFYKALAARTLREVSEQNVRTLQDHLSEAKLFKKAGLSTNFDLLRVEVQLSEAQSEVTNARDNEVLSLMRLSDVTDRGYDGRELAGQMPVFDAKLVESTAALSFETVKRKDFEAMSERAEGLAKLSDAASKSWVPRIGLYAEYDHYNNRSESWNLVGDDFREAHTVGVQLTWPLFSGFADEAQRRQAAEKVAQAEYSLRMTRAKARTDLEFWRRKLTYFTTVFRTRTEEVTKSAESVRLAKEGRKVGSRTNTDLLDAESELFRARAGQVNAQIGSIEALINLELATGRQLYRFE